MTRFLLVQSIIWTAIIQSGADTTTVSDNGDWRAISPNGKHFAALTARPNETMIWRKDLETGLLEVVELLNTQGKITDAPDTPQYGNYVRYDIEGRLGTRAEWSPDSRFLVITTVSSGGHSPWHFNAYLYCTNERTLRYMDETIGPVVSPDFCFVGPHTVRMGMGLPGPDGIDSDHPKDLEINLDKKAAEMKKEAPTQSGNLAKP